MFEHPMFPSLELLKRWEDLHFDEGENYDAMLIQAYQAGADAELEACCEWLHWQNLATHQDLIPSLRADRRPKPPSLKELNLKHLEVMERDGHYLPEIISDLRRALESLPD